MSVLAGGGGLPFQLACDVPWVSNYTYYISFQDDDFLDMNADDVFSSNMNLQSVSAATESSSGTMKMESWEHQDV